jgi:hypothetical protein
MGNLTFTKEVNMHKADISQPNHYRDLIQKIACLYGNIANLPIFGFGAKTNSLSQKPAPIFPLSRGIRNPFTPNDDETIDLHYKKCLEVLEMALPVNLNPFFSFFKQLGVHVKTRISRKAQQDKSAKNTVDTVYVLYVLSTGLIDDVKLLIQTLRQPEWRFLPL